MTMADAIDAGHRQPCPTCGYDGGCPASHWIDNRGSVEELWARAHPWARAFGAWPGDETDAEIAAALPFQPYGGTL